MSTFSEHAEHELTDDIATSISAVRAGVGIPGVCFLVASATVVAGMALGIYMGIVHDHQLMPVHAHMNVIGWLSLFAVGLFYKAHDKARGMVVNIQVGALALGQAIMTACLAMLLLHGGTLAFAGVVAGSIMLFTSMVMFFGVVWRAVKEAAVKAAT